MNKLLQRRFAVIAFVAAMALLPATAQAAGEEASGTVEGTPATSTGWVPQGSEGESSGSESTTVRHGSSLGSGASPSQSHASTPEASSTPPPASTHEAPAATPVTKAPVSTPQSGSEPAVVKTPVVVTPVVKPAPVGLGDARQVSAAESAAVADAGAKPTSPASHAKPVAASHAQVASSSSALLPLLAIVVCGLILLYAGTKLVLGPVEPFRRYRSSGPV